MIDAAQRTAAKVVGIAYLATNATAILATFINKLIVHGDAARTAANIMGSERLFRVGIVSDLFVWIADVAMIVGLYVILRSINKNIALLALAWRLIETSVLAVATLNRLNAVPFFVGPGYLQSFEAARLHALGMIALGAYAADYNIGLIFFGLGSAVFSYLLYRSNYIPRILSGWGVFASLLTAVCSIAFVIFPTLADTLAPGCYGPIFLFEVVTGLWLLIKGLRQPGTAG
jgi:Domain of unknown function (DUF4386)